MILLSDADRRFLELFEILPTPKIRRRTQSVIGLNRNHHLGYYSNAAGQRSTEMIVQEVFRSAENRDPNVDTLE